MRNIGIILVLLSLFSCETKYNYIDSGLANGRFDGTMYDYLHSNSYDWDSTLLLVERAGLEDLFQGKQVGYEKITFFGPTNLSILRWMIEQGYNAIREIPEATCRELILRHVVAGIHWRDDIPRGEQILGETQGKGGKFSPVLSGQNSGYTRFRIPIMIFRTWDPCICMSLRLTREHRLMSLQLI